MRVCSSLFLDGALVLHRLLHAVDLADGLPFRRLEGQAQEVQKRIQAEREEEKLSPLVMDPQAIPIHEFIVSQIMLLRRF